MERPHEQNLNEFVRAVRAKDVDAVRSLLSASKDARAHVKDPLFAQVVGG